MIDSDKRHFADMIGGLAETFGRKLSKAGLLAYWIGLKDLDVSEVDQACGAALQACKFMPTVAELRELCGQDSVESRAIKAWSSVSSAAGDVGSYRAISFQDATINAVVRNMGGWPELLSRTGDEFDKWARQEFIKCYKSLYGRVSSGSELGKPLTSLSTKVEPPVFVAVGYSPHQLALAEPTTVPALPYVQAEDGPKRIGLVLKEASSG